MKIFMTRKNKIYTVIAIIVIFLSIGSCKIPQTTLNEDTLKMSLPSVPKDSGVSILPIWRDSRLYTSSFD